MVHLPPRIVDVTDEEEETDESHESEPMNPKSESTLEVSNTTPQTLATDNSFALFWYTPVALIFHFIIMAFQWLSGRSRVC